MVVVNFRISKEMLAEVDDIVLRSNGDYTYRSEVFRKAIQYLIDLERHDDFLHTQKMFLMSVIPS